MFIVYRHIFNNEVLYIGMGQLGREKDLVNRSREWKEFTKGKDLDIDILWETESRKEAYEKEKEFIALYGRRDLLEGTLINKTNGGGWLQGVTWTDVKKEEYAKRAKNLGNLKNWQRENGAAVKGKKLPKQKQQHIEARVKKIKKAWSNKTEKEKYLQTSLFINNNPSHIVTHCPYCDRDIKGASAYKRFHGNKCKHKNN